MAHRTNTAVTLRWLSATPAVWDTSEKKVTTPHKHSHKVGRTCTSTVTVSLSTLPKAERRTLLIISNFFCELLAIFFFWSSERTFYNLKCEEHVNIQTDVQCILLIRADLCAAARFCVPSPPTEGWCQSCWPDAFLQCGWLRSLSYMFPPECAAALSWPLTSSPLLRTLVLRHLKQKSETS